MALDLFRLLVFVQVVECNGYSAAARHLHLAQATASRHVHELERALGSELLRYENRAVHLTQAGQEVYRTARSMLREQDHLEETLRDLREGRRGRVRIGASMAFEQRYFFERVVAPFRHAHDGVLLSIRFGHSGREAQAVLDHELDLAYVLKWHLPPDVDFEVLHKARFTFLVPHNHPLTHKAAVTVHDIGEVGLITAPLTGVESLFYDQILRQFGVGSEHSVLEIDGMQARVIAAEAGLGVFGTFYPDYAGEAVPGSLVPLAVDGPVVDVDVGLVSRGGEPRTASVEAFAEWMRTLGSPA